jgi:hypothetical protein
MNDVNPHAQVLSQAATTPAVIGGQAGVHGTEHNQVAAAPTVSSATLQPTGSVRRLAPFLKMSIILLAGLAIASISLIFIGSLGGKSERVFATFVLFGVFVALTGIDARLGQRAEWYTPVALAANSYILGLLLVVIWVTRYDPFGFVVTIFVNSVFAVGIVRLTMFACQLLLRADTQQHSNESNFAFATSAAAMLSALLFTAPIGINVFRLSVPTLYWNIATAVLILTALGASITILLRWSAGAEQREKTRMMQAQNAATQNVQSHVQPVASLLAWPTLADGRPLPAGPDGQPDFSVLR